MVGQSNLEWVWVLKGINLRDLDGKEIHCENTWKLIRYATNIFCSLQHLNQLKQLISNIQIICSWFFLQSFTARQLFSVWPICYKMSSLKHIRKYSFVMLWLILSPICQCVILMLLNNMYCVNVSCQSWCTTEFLVSMWYVNVSLCNNNPIHKFTNHLYRPAKSGQCSSDPIIQSQMFLKY